MDSRQSSFDTADGAQIRYRLRRATGTDAPETLVLAHPHSGTMAGFTATLAGFDGPVLIWNRRGYGGSTRGDYGATQGEDLRALLDHLELRVVACAGVAAGGAAVAEFATRWPDRVRALGFACSFMGLPARDWFAQTGELPPEGTTEARELSDVFRHAAEAEVWRAQEAANRAAGAGEPPQESRMDTVAIGQRVHLHLATGAQDRLFTPAMLTHAAKRSTQARTTVFPVLSHAPHVEAPALFCAWLRGLVSPA